MTLITDNSSIAAYRCRRCPRFAIRPSRASSQRGNHRANRIKLDLYEEFKPEFGKPGQPVFAAVGPAKYLSITGQGAPGGEQFRSHISALFAVAFILKMAEKHVGHNYKVGHLEGQWWADGGSDFGMQRLLIRVPPIPHAEGSGRCHTD